jgi:BirA family biotin operon repressor/biotin-[acetyl-CoA-carboxylase] ligase
MIGAVATARAIRHGWKVNARVRWPNDVVADGRKIAGILVESKSKGNELIYAALGLGINANVDTSKIESIRGSSTSLQMLKGQPINRTELILNTLSEVEAIYELILSRGEGAVMEILRDLDWSSGRRVRVRTVDREVAGVFDGYETMDTVRVSTEGGLERLETNFVVSVDYKSD